MTMIHPMMMMLKVVVINISGYVDDGCKFLAGVNFFVNVSIYFMDRKVRVSDGSRPFVCKALYDGADEMPIEPK